jgi:hypothetical protein
MWSYLSERAQNLISDLNTDAMIAVIDEIVRPNERRRAEDANDHDELNSYLE